MKTKTLLSILALGLIVSAFGQKPTMELTFTAENNGQYAPLDSILIENLTQGGDTTLNAPDTVLVLDYVTRIGYNQAIEKNRFSVSQNYPNPFKEKTEVNLYLPEKDDIKITVRDILGRELDYYKNTLNRGNHSFAFYPGNQKYYLLTVTGKQTSKTIKMLNANPNTVYSGKCKIVYNGYEDNLISYKSQKEINNFGFSIGDQLKYTCYSDFGEITIIDSPSGNQTYTFQFASGVPCPGMPTITYDGQVYNTVLIGSQCWLKENLNVGTMLNDSQSQQNNSTIEKYCLYDNPANCVTYGGLYMWDEMMQYTTTQGVQGICPPDWHLPTDAEWMTMEESLGMCSGTGSGCSGATGWRGTDEGSKLADNEPLWTNGNLDQNANFGTSGFTGLPGGYRHPNGLFFNLSEHARFWSSSESGSMALARILDYLGAHVGRVNSYEVYGFSVRCVRD